MDGSYYVEALWRASVPLELVPDLAAWVVCIAVVLWCLRFVVVWHPRVCLTGTLAWLGWLAWQVFRETGRRALQMVQHRGSTAMKATDRFAQLLLALVKAWFDFFLPFLSDLFQWVRILWRSMSLQQRFIFVCSLLSLYAIVEALRMFRRHKQAIKHVLFHATFAAGGPLVWFASKSIPPGWLPWCVSQAISTAPAIMSVAALRQPPAPKRPPRRASLFFGGAAAEDGGSAQGPPPDAARVARQRAWLSYWVCWPVLAVLEAAIRLMPRLAHALNVQGHLQPEFQRALLTFAVWLQFWQGSAMLNFTMQTLLSHTNLLEYMASFFGARGLQALGFARGGLTLTGRTTVTGMRRLMQISRRLWLLVGASVLAVALLGLMVYVFYSALSVLSHAVTMLMWCLAALDSADTLTHEAEDFYSKKLSFWVLAMAWSLLTSLPYGVGAVLRLFTPVAFPLLLVAGEPLFRYLVLPLINRMVKAVDAACGFALSVLRAMRDIRSGEPRSCIGDDGSGTGDAGDNADSAGGGGVDSAPVAGSSSGGPAPERAGGRGNVGDTGGSSSNTLDKDGGDAGASDVSSGSCPRNAGVSDGDGATCGGSADPRQDLAGTGGADCGRAACADSEGADGSRRDSPGLGDAGAPGGPAAHGPAPGPAGAAGVTAAAGTSGAAPGAASASIPPIAACAAASASLPPDAAPESAGAGSAGKAPHTTPRQRRRSKKGS